MKTRIGFVSNSSTTSFSIYGCQIPFETEEDQYKIMSGVVKKHKKTFDKCDGFNETFEEAGKSLAGEQMPYTFGEYVDDLQRDFTETMDELSASAGLNFYYGDNSYYLYCGLPFEEMKNKETKEDFMNRISKKIDVLFGKKMKCGHHSESYRDG